MLKKEIEIGGKYIAKVSGNLTTVQIDSEALNKGWWATNVVTGRSVHIRSAQRLRRPAGGKFIITCDKRVLAVIHEQPVWVEDKSQAHKFDAYSAAAVYFLSMAGYSIMEARSVSHGSTKIEEIAR